MATATSRATATAAALGAIALAIAFLLGASGAGHAASPSRRPAFAWLRPGPPPAGWAQVSVPAGTATVSYPPTWRPAAGDTGTATVVLRDRTGAVGGYLNITPREGAERLAGWPSFRIARNRDEGDTDVRALASATGLRFRAASGSCVIDDYRSRVGANAYREVACLVTGRRATDVLIAATALRDWSRLGSDAERAVASFIER